MATDFLQHIKQLGLPDTEAKVYLASYKLGPTSVQEIAKKAHMSRTTAYDAIASLQERGLMSTFQRGKKTYYASEDPDRLISHFRDEVASLQSKVEAFGRMTSELELQAGGERPTVRFFEGREAVFAMFDDLAKVNVSHFDEVSNFDDLYEHLDPEIVKEAQKVIDPSKIDMRILHRGELRREPRSGVKYAQLPEDLGNFHGNIWIYENRVSFLAFRGKIFSVIIESEPFAQTARILFEAAWRFAKR